MSESYKAWTIAENLKRKNEQGSFNTTDDIDRVIDLERNSDYFDRTELLESLRYHFTELNLSSDEEERIVDGLIAYLDNHKYEFKVGNMEVKINEDDNLHVYFKENNNLCEIKDGDSYSETISTEVHTCDFISQGKRDATKVKRDIYVINGEDINEYITVINENNKDAIIDSLLNELEGYMKDENGVFKTDIDASLVVKPLTHYYTEIASYRIKADYLKYREDVPAGLYDTNILVPEINKRNIEIDKGNVRYKDYLEKAQEFENKCYIIYDLIKRAVMKKNNVIGNKR